MTAEQFLEYGQRKANSYYNEVKLVNSRAAERINAYVYHIHRMIREVKTSNNAENIKFSMEEIDITMKKIEDTYRKEVC